MHENDLTCRPLLHASAHAKTFPQGGRRSRIGGGDSEEIGIDGQFWTCHVQWSPGGCGSRRAWRRWIEREYSAAGISCPRRRLRRPPGPGPWAERGGGSAGDVRLLNRPCARLPPPASWWRQAATGWRSAGGPVSRSWPGERAAARRAHGLSAAAPARRRPVDGLWHGGWPDPPARSRWAARLRAQRFCLLLQRGVCMVWAATKRRPRFILKI